MPKIVDSKKYRKELLHQCFDLFADRGYANVTTRQIAKKPGISTGAMYHYFPSYDRVQEVSETVVYIAMILLMLNRLVA